MKQSLKNQAKGGKTKRVEEMGSKSNSTTSLQSQSGKRNRDLKDNSYHHNH